MDIMKSDVRYGVCGSLTLRNKSPPSFRPARQDVWSFSITSGGAGGGTQPWEAPLGGHLACRQLRVQLLLAQSDSSRPVDGGDLYFCLLCSDTHLWLVWADSGLVCKAVLWTVISPARLLLIITV